MKKKGQVGLLQKGEKSPVKVDVVITCNDKDMVDMATGKVPPQKLFAAKVSGVEAIMLEPMNGTLIRTLGSIMAVAGTAHQSQR